MKIAIGIILFFVSLNTFALGSKKIILRTENINPVTGVKEKAVDIVTCYTPEIFSKFFHHISKRVKLSADEMVKTIQLRDCDDLYVISDKMSSKYSDQRLIKLAYSCNNLEGDKVEKEIHYNILKNIPYPKKSLNQKITIYIESHYEKDAKGKAVLKSKESLFFAGNCVK